MSNYTAEERAAWDGYFQSMMVQALGEERNPPVSLAQRVGESARLADAMLAARRERFGVGASNDGVNVTLTRDEVNHLRYAMNVAEHHDDFGDGEQGRKRHPLVVSKLEWCAEEHRRKTAK